MTTLGASSPPQPPSPRPRLRIGSTIHGHGYDLELYGPMEDRVAAVAAPWPGPGLIEGLTKLDLLHIGWPEHWTGVDPAWTESVIAEVGSVGIPTVVTMHNLIGHADKSENARQCYQLWAAAVDAAIHHSDWGRGVAQQEYSYSPSCRHVVIPHGHWGSRFNRVRGLSRRAAEERLGWAPVPIRLGVIGGHRVEKKIQVVLDAFAAVDRDDMELVLRVSDGDRVPDDPRIVIEQERLDEDLYLTKLRALDALVMPFARHGMLTTGTAADALAAGLAVITSDWGYLTETFGGTEICYGQSTEDLARCMADLDAGELAARGKAVAARAALFEWGPIADATFSLFEELTA